MTDNTLGGGFTYSELVSSPCGMTNAQAALIAAAIGYAGEQVMEAASTYKTWLDQQDKER